MKVKSNVKAGTGIKLVQHNQTLLRVRRAKKIRR
jgi:hypothetical protein